MTINNSGSGRPNFAANGTTAVAAGVDGAGVSEALKAKRSTRPEIGAMWKRNSKSTGTEYLSIRLKLTREKIQELLTKPTVESGVDGTELVVEVDLVAFPNSNAEGNPRRPSFRVYEELSK